MTEPLKRTDPEVVKALANDAKDLMEDRAFVVAIAKLKNQWYGELMRVGGDPNKIVDLRARLEALEAIPQLLNNFMNSALMEQQRGSHGGRR
jgi:predicted NBD/HSP70 family sugar kinase